MLAPKLRPAMLVAMMTLALAVGAFQAQASNSGPIIVHGGISVGSAPANETAEQAPEIPAAEPAVVQNETADLAAEARERTEQGASIMALAVVAMLAIAPCMGAAVGWMPGRVRV